MCAIEDSELSRISRRVETTFEKYVWFEITINLESKLHI